MTVRELIARLEQFDPDAEAHYAVDGAWNGSYEIYDVYESTAQYGIALKTPPPPVKTVVMATGMEGL